MLDSDDFLLYVISASKAIDYIEFRETFNRLYLQRAGVLANPEDMLGYQRNRTLRILDSLGHCDIHFHEGHSRIYCAPPILSRLPLLGLPQALLCGSRSPSTLAELRSARKSLGGKFEIESHSQETRSVCVPARIVIVAESEDILNKLSSFILIPYESDPPAWSLAQVSGSIHEYCESLTWLLSPEINWRRSDYDTGSLRFRPFYTSAAETRLAAYENPVTGLNTYHLWRKGERAQVDPYFGRYVVLSSECKNILLFDAHKLLLAVPSGAPLPRLLARSIVLCSGYAPHYIESAVVPVESPEIRGFDLYSGVPADVASAVASKLGQNLIHASLHV